MKRIFNFSAGPCTLPLSALEKAQSEFVDFKGTGMSLIEMSHRSKEYDAVHMDAMDLIRELFGVPEGHKILFLGGGATLQFGMVPMNFLHKGESADYVITGSWAKKAYQDAAKVGDAKVVWDGKESNYMTLPDPGSVKASPGAAYLHLTSNETIGGVQWKRFPDGGGVPVVCDMSSDFMSRRVNVGDFDLIYAGAQKNAGPAGVTIVIVKESFLEKCPDNLPAYLNFKTHAEKDSLYNTPPVFAVYMVGLTMHWLKGIGGLEAAERLADERAKLIYGAMEKSGGFYRCPVHEPVRSKMNIVFRLPDEDLEKRFISETTEKGMIGLKGHRSVGGCRASVYNAMPVDGAGALADFMIDFARKNG